MDARSYAAQGAATLDCRRDSRRYHQHRVTWVWTVSAYVVPAAMGQAAFLQ